jgi:hypothetical protein
MTERTRPASEARETHDESRLSLIGLDVSGRRRAVRLRIGWPVVIVALLLALGLTALRVDLIRMRYALADALASEQELLEQQRMLTVEMRMLRDPSGLASRARELGFVHPERVIHLPLAAPGTAPGGAPSLIPAETALALGATRP